MARARSAADEVAKAEKIVVTARARADSARQAVAAAESRIAERAPERLLSRFVEERAASEEYGRQLGLPTRIRRDLDSLRDYLKNLAGATHASRRADRVVLFIDDLDRCGPDIVVKVLEAVHILLSSNLFVVVVGVDVRWLTQSLATHHADQFRDNAALDPGEFLEKIFQVPFWIPAMSAGGSQAIVSDALPEVRRTGGDSPPLPGATQPGLAPASAGGGATPGDAGRGNQSAEAAPLPTLEAVQLGEEEHKAVLRWGSLAGDTPRRLKRFARSYLILRASLTPAERDSFVVGSAFDTVARLLALNIADPKEWSSLTAHLTSNATSWPAQSLGAAWQRLFGPDTQPPAPADCRAWLPEVERFGFVLGGRSGSPAAA